MRIHPLSAPHDLHDLSSYWSLSMHDNHYGAVTCLISTFDDQYVLSGGADGNLFVYQANMPTAAQREEAASVEVSGRVGGERSRERELRGRKKEGEGKRTLSA